VTHVVTTTHVWCVVLTQSKLHDKRVIMRRDAYVVCVRVSTRRSCVVRVTRRRRRHRRSRVRATHDRACACQRTRVRGTCVCVVRRRTRRTRHVDDRVDASSRFGARRRRSRVVDCTFHVVDACILMCHIDAMHHNRANDEYLHKTREFMHKTRQNTRATCTFRVLRV
jgi:hypothetical protein